MVYFRRPELNERAFGKTNLRRQNETKRQKTTSESKTPGSKMLGTTILLTTCDRLVHFTHLKNAAPFGHESAVHVTCHLHMQLGFQGLPTWQCQVGSPLTSGLRHHV